MGNFGLRASIPAESWWADVLASSTRTRLYPDDPSDGLCYCYQTQMNTSVCHAQGSCWEATVENLYIVTNDRIGCCRTKRDQLPESGQRFCGRTGCSGIASDSMPTSVGTNDETSCFLHPVAKVRYTKTSRKRLNRSAHELHNRQSKVENLWPVY